MYVKRLLHCITHFVGYTRITKLFFSQPSHTNPINKFKCISLHQRLALISVITIMNTGQHISIKHITDREIWNQQRNIHDLIELMNIMLASVVQYRVIPPQINFDKNVKFRINILIKKSSLHKNV